MPSEHLQYFVLDPLKNYFLRCLSLGYMARPGGERVKRCLLAHILMSILFFASVKKDARNASKNED